MNIEDIIKYEVGIDNIGDVEILVDGLIVWDYKVQNGNLHLQEDTFYFLLNAYIEVQMDTL
jgi:hypothetical protein